MHIYELIADNNEIPIEFGKFLVSYMNDIEKDTSPSQQSAADASNSDIPELVKVKSKYTNMGTHMVLAWMIEETEERICVPDVQRCECGVMRSLSICTGCMSVLYCSKRCQEREWSEHKHTCKK